MKFRINIFIAFTFMFFSFCAYATEIKTDHAVLRALDKITGRTSTIVAPVAPEKSVLEKETKQETQTPEEDSISVQNDSYKINFGTLNITVKACFKTPPEETPENAAFLNIIETKPNEEPIDIFSGWMFSSTPALSAIEHSVYDIWVLKCADKNEAIEFAKTENEKVKNSFLILEDDQENSEENEDDEELED